MIALAITAALVSAGTEAKVATADPLAAIAAYAGTWRVEIDRVASEFGPAGHTVSVLRNDCWRADKFLACAQTVNGVQAALLVYTWDGAAGAYGAYVVPADGGPARKGKLVIQAADWIFPWDQEQGGAVVHFRVVNHFVGHDRIEYRQEYSRDGANWTIVERGAEVRQPS